MRIENSDIHKKMTDSTKSIPDKNRTDYMKLCQILKNTGYDAYLVGGCVRDMYLGRTPHDFDITTNATPEQIKGRLAIADIPFTRVGEKHGTIVARMNDEEYEITTYRKDCGYEDGRHPDKVEFVSDIKEDLARRDFTMNAMAYDPIDNIFIDPFDGRKDCDGKLIRTVGDPIARFSEDGLRIMRALRFSVTLGFDIGRETNEAMARSESMLDSVSKERITEELRKMLTSGMPVSKQLDTFRWLFFHIIPEMRPEVSCEQHNKYHHHDVYRHTLSVVDNCKSDKFEIKLAALLHDIGKPDTKAVGEDGYDHFVGHPEVSAKIAASVISKDLRLTNDERDLTIGLVREHDKNFSISEKRLRKAILEHGEPFLRDLMVLQQADFDDHIIPKDIKPAAMENWHTSKEKTEQMFADIKASDSVFSMRDMNINGNDLKDMGFIGPQIGSTLKDMLERVATGTLENDHDALMQYAENARDEIEAETYEDIYEGS